ncbi:Hypothetical predicted protein [Pelobates cultripes]|uniref:UPAR/Ly6 domain-containing protein n=1 Tax=Pelobates cultripes TaxID=61616 RepID=A0AAD1T3X4_PELCU|nr:Hypothetical predicted protein [Pelobates cultripes]
MNSFLGYVCVLSAIVGTGHSLSCVECVSSSGTTCLGTTTTCSNGSVCGSQYTVGKVGSVTTTLFVKACVFQDQCSMNGSITFNEGSTRTGISCCNTDNCTPPVPSLPQLSTQQNGLTCRSCISGTSNWCYTSDTIQCTGNEDMCLLQATTIAGLKTAIRGCATKSICDLGSQTVTDTVKITCTSGTIGLHSNMFLSAIISFVLLKCYF